MMTDRSYSLVEIDQMRALIDNKYLYGAFRPHFSEAGIGSRAFYEEEKTACVEEQLRTHMVAGLGPDDLVDG